MAHRAFQSGEASCPHGNELVGLKSRMPKSAIWRVAGGLALSLLAIGASLQIGASNARAEPIMRQAEVHLRGYPSGARALKVALLSDIHLGNWAMDARRLRAIVEQVNAAQPDLVLLAGDFITGHDEHGAAERAAGLSAPLEGLHAPLGVIAVLGNHDHWTAPAAVRVGLGNAGVVVLENQAVRRGPLAVIGIGDRFSGHDDVPASLSAARAVGGIPLVLTHSPDVVPDLPADQLVVLAGHTHCGQVVLPWFGPVVTRSPRNQWRRLYDPRYRCGIIRDGQRTTVVTAGVGSGTSPVRLSAMRDWWLVTLRGAG